MSNSEEQQNGPENPGFTAKATIPQPPQAEPAPKKKKGWLTNLFTNAVVGGAVAFAVKSCAVPFLCSTAMLSPLAIAIVGSAVAGLAVGATLHGVKTLNGTATGSLGGSMLKSAVTAGIFGGIFSELLDYEPVKNFLFGESAEAPVVEHKTDTETAFDTIIDAIEVLEENTTTEDTITEEDITNDVTVSMSPQDMKDEAVRLFNDGSATNDQDALALFNQAASMDNFGANIDLNYIEYWGLADVTPNPESAINGMKATLESMREKGLGDTLEYLRGQDLLDQWTGTNPSPAAAVTVAETTVVTPIAPIEVAPVDAIVEETPIAEDALVVEEVPVIEEAPKIAAIPEQTAEPLEEQFEEQTVEPWDEQLEEQTAEPWDKQFEKTAPADVTMEETAPVAEEVPTTTLIPEQSVEPWDKQFEETAPVATTETPDSNGMVEREVMMPGEVAVGTTGCQGGSVIITSEDISFICPMGGSETANVDAVAPGTKILITPPPAALPFLPQ